MGINGIQFEQYGRHCEIVFVVHAQMRQKFAQCARARVHHRHSRYAIPIQCCCCFFFFSNIYFRFTSISSHELLATFEGPILFNRIEIRRFLEVDVIVASAIHVTDETLCSLVYSITYFTINVKNERMRRNTARIRRMTVLRWNGIFCSLYGMERRRWESAISVGMRDKNDEQRKKECSFHFINKGYQQIKHMAVTIIN